MGKRENLGVVKQFAVLQETNKQVYHFPVTNLGLTKVKTKGGIMKRLDKCGKHSLV